MKHRYFLTKEEIKLLIHHYLCESLRWDPEENPKEIERAKDNHLFWKLELETLDNEEKADA